VAERCQSSLVQSSILEGVMRVSGLPANGWTVWHGPAVTAHAS
jgi:hypothetical protein